MALEQRVAVLEVQVERLLTLLEEQELLPEVVQNLSLTCQCLNVVALALDHLHLLRMRRRSTTR